MIDNRIEYCRTHPRPFCPFSTPRLQRGGDTVGRGNGVLHQRERAAEIDALLPQPRVVRRDGDVRQHAVLHDHHVPAHLHQVSQASCIPRFAAFRLVDADWSSVTCVSPHVCDVSASRC